MTPTSTTPPVIDQDRARRPDRSLRRRLRRRCQLPADHARRSPRPVPARWATATPVTPAELADAHGHRRAVRARVAVRHGGRRIRHVRRRTAERFHLTPEQALALADEDEPRVPARRVPARVRRRQGRAAHRARVPHRRRLRLARARPRPVPRHRALLPARLRRQPRARAGSRRSRACRPSSSAAAAWPTSGAATARRRSSWPRRSRARRSSARTTTRPRSRRARARGRARGRGGPLYASRSRAPTDFSGSGYDLVCMFDCLHDMGDPVGAARPRARDARRRRHVADRRAVRERPARGQPQPGRPDLLRGLDAAVHARVAVAGRRAGARRAGRRGAARARSSERGGFTRFRRATETPFNLVLEARP